ncbi:MAG TPA: Wadjet anti-phage system protein JetD domain-containing protein [Trinickia sp.]
MSWTTPADLRARLLRLWERGEWQSGLVDGTEGLFPLRLAIKGPNSSELAERFDAVRAWIAELAATPRVRIEWREINHRILGLQRLPQAAWIDSLDDALALAGKRRDAAQFMRLLDATRSRQPKLVSWLAQRPLQALECADDWERLLAVVEWLQAHPKPDVYLRQAEIASVDTKFIEARRGVLAQWLDLLLPSDAIDSSRTGTAQFAARYGFREKPPRIRFRVLDERLAFLPGLSRPDVTLDADSFGRLALPCRHVFITENETNFLAFPDVPESIVLFGAGYGWETLDPARWLTDCALHYWGDIDTHGFAILDQLRCRFPHVGSFLMDRATLMAHEGFWGNEADQVVRDLPRLTAQERELFDDLRDNRIRHGLRLEQERVGFGWVRAALEERVCA